MKEKIVENKCITGEENTCLEYTINKKGSIENYPPGTILTMQQRENTINNIAWSDNGKTSGGPITLLTQLESATNDWINVRSQTYSMGTTNLSGLTNGQYTNCTSYNNCTSNRYTLSSRTAKARILTLQESVYLGCTRTKVSCPIWLYNYLESSIQDGGTVNECINDRNGFYWLFQSDPSGQGYAYNIGGGYVSGQGSVNGTVAGARAVVDINK